MDLDELANLSTQVLENVADFFIYPTTQCKDRVYFLLVSSWENLFARVKGFDGIN